MPTSLNSFVDKQDEMVAELYSNARLTTWDFYYEFVFQYVYW